MPSKVRDSKPTGYYVQQRPWTPTKRRGPIAAEFSSPGPAIVCLPPGFGPLSSSGDSRKSNAPAFSFGIKFEEKRDTSSPGPGEYRVDGVTKVGKDWSPAAFMSPRYKEPQPFKTPAPGAYDPRESASSTHEQSPSYSFGHKVEDGVRDKTPSPSDYSPDCSSNSIKGQAPSYSFGSKVIDPKQFTTPAPGAYNPEKSTNQMSTHIQFPSFSMGAKPNGVRIPKTPGPGAYNVTEADVYKGRKQPSYTISSRTTLPVDKCPKPAPTDYQPEKVWINKTSSPRFTFGVRHSQYSSTC